MSYIGKPDFNSSNIYSKVEPIFPVGTGNGSAIVHCQVWLITDDTLNLICCTFSDQGCFSSNDDELIE